MAEWTGTILTLAGRNLMAKSLAGEQIKFTRVALGEGVPGADTDLYTLPDLITPKLDLPARSITVEGDGTSKIEVILTNQTLSQGFFAREIGVFAMDGEEEILFAYDNAGDRCDYVPAWGRINPVNMIVDVFIVVGQADNITITINNSLLFITKEEFLAHINAENPHPNFLQIGTTVDNLTNVFVNRGNQRLLDQITMGDFRRLILGGDASQIPNLLNRLNQLEIEAANIALQLEAEGNCPDSNLLLVEDFVVPDKIDTFEVKVKSIVAGDNGIDVETLTGLIPGAWYTVSDGVNQEYIQIKSCIKNGSVYRLLTTEDIIYTYNVDNTMIYRTTAQIGSGVVYGSGDKKGFNWQPSQVWSGVNANVATILPLETTQDKADEFVAKDDIVFTADGLISLEVIN